jgi:hypothetical protein
MVSVRRTKLLSQGELLLLLFQPASVLCRQFGSWTYHGFAVDFQINVDDETLSLSNGEYV